MGKYWRSRWPYTDTVECSQSGPLPNSLHDYKDLGCCISTGILKHEKEDNRSGAGGNGFEAWNELVKKYDYQSDEVLRILRSDLEKLTMEPGTDLDVFSLQAAHCRAEQ